MASLGVKRVHYVSGKILNLNLKLKIFPTKTDGNFQAETFTKKLDETHLKKTNEIYKFSKKVFNVLCCVCVGKERSKVLAQNNVS